jgi:hypothetical protein
MDLLFVRNVPDILSWGNYQSSNSSNPRHHIRRTLVLNIHNDDHNYQSILNDLAKAIASARLSELDLEKWRLAAFGVEPCSQEDREIIARALKRGISASGADWRTGAPRMNLQAFKGYVAEVLHYCIRVTLRNRNIAHPIHFEPSRPKESSGTPGIDLLEVGGVDNQFYFTVWECKGTDAVNPGSRFYNAACQLVDKDGTALNSFMETCRVLQEAPIIHGNDELRDFIREMPRIFYSSSPKREKKLGGIVCSHHPHTDHGIDCFPRKIDDNAFNRRSNCEAIAIHINDFITFREDLYRTLWNIYWT